MISNKPIYICLTLTILLSGCFMASSMDTTSIEEKTLKHIIGLDSLIVDRISTINYSMKYFNCEEKNIYFSRDNYSGFSEITKLNIKSNLNKNSIELKLFDDKIGTRYNHQKCRRFIFARIEVLQEDPLDLALTILVLSSSSGGGGSGIQYKLLRKNDKYIIGGVVAEFEY